MNGKTNKLIRLELKLLNEISKSKNHSQRSLSKDLNVALGLANALIKKFVSKGILKLQEAPMRRYFYYLTPKGFVEKAKLTQEFLESSLLFYSKAKEEYEKLIKIYKKKNKKIIFLGKSELTEIATLAASINNIKIDFIFCPNEKQNYYCGVKVLKKIDKKKTDFSDSVFILTDFFEPKKFYTKFESAPDIIIPKFLNIDS